MNVKFDFEMNPQPRGTSKAGMRVQIVVESGDSVAITGSSDGEEFQGFLVFTKKQRSTESPEGARGLESLAGGDECYINGKWYNPCPIVRG